MTMYTYHNIMVQVFQRIQFKQTFLPFQMAVGQRDTETATMAGRIKLSSFVSLEPAKHFDESFVVLHEPPSSIVPLSLLL